MFSFCLAASAALWVKRFQISGLQGQGWGQGMLLLLLSFLKGDYHGIAAILIN